VGPGGALLVPTTYGVWVENTGTDELVFLIAGSPPWGAGQEVHPWRPHPEGDTNC
jgi:oxalate decarboxylase/phosphoglucose isomerase-like protein (cupin superfamily)